MISHFSIGDLSKKSGIKIPTIRYYEEIGLLPVPERSQSGRRIYTQDDVRLGRFIKHSRDLGFEIEDIRSLLALLKDPKHPCKDADLIAQKHLEQVNRHIASLEALREELTIMLQHCPGHKSETCQVIKTLSDHSNCLHEKHD